MVCCKLDVDGFHPRFGCSFFEDPTGHRSRLLSPKFGLACAACCWLESDTTLLSSDDVGLQTRKTTTSREPSHLGLLSGCSPGDPLQTGLSLLSGSGLPAEHDGVKVDDYATARSVGFSNAICRILE